MDYFNKFQNFVSKGVNNVKNAINPQLQNQNQNSIFGTNNQTNQTNQPQKQKTTSLSEFLLSGNKNKSESPSPQKQNVNDVIAINPYSNQSRKDTKPDDEFMKGFTLINGESPVEWERCIIMLDTQEFPCKALITQYRIVIIPHFSSTNLSQSLTSMTFVSLFPEGYFSLPIHKIATCEKTIEKTNTFQYSIIISSRDGRDFELIFRIGQNESFFYALSSLIQSKQQPTYSTFAVRYNTGAQYEEDGWNVYVPEQEYARQGLRNLDTTTSQDPTKLFRRTTMNEKYALCETYPKFLITSAHINDDELKQASAFRTKNRIPSLAYFFYKNNASIWRSSQTKNGITNNRNAFDEKLLSYISDLSSGKKLIVYDARPYLSAYANKLKGAGFEDENNYVRTEVKFCDINNIHAARSSLGKIYHILKEKDFRHAKKFHSAFESSGWPEFIYGIIKSSTEIALSVKQGYSCLIHCSDGWDRASQLTAFSQMLIDPYYRTIRGYMSLIEKDFLSFGHQFKYRNGYYNQKEVHEDQNSPIFLQYLDATHQLLVNYPMYFEFNMKFLIYIANNINSGKYGTFLYNNEKERDEKEARTKTMSIWTDMLKNINEYMNPFYEKRTQEEYFFVPLFSSHKIRMWEEFFMQFTQLEVGLSYDRYINRWYKWKEGKVITKRDRIVTNVQMAIRDKEEEDKSLNEKEDEISRLKECLMELVKKTKDTNKEIIDKLTEVNKKTIMTLEEIPEVEKEEKKEVEKEEKKEEEVKNVIVEPISKNSTENTIEAVKEEKKEENTEEKLE